MNRCGNCLKPHHEHRRRMDAPPVCPDFKDVYREGTEEELSAAYDKAFPNGPTMIASIDISTDEGKAKAAAVIGPAALQKHFGPGGGGMPAFEQSLRDAGA